MKIELWQYNLLALSIGVVCGLMFKRKAVAAVTSTLLVVLVWFGGTAINMAAIPSAGSQSTSLYAEALFWSIFEPVSGSLFALLGIMGAKFFSAVLEQFR